jgi:hypothetical protein
MILPDPIRDALARNAHQLSPITLTLAEYPPGYPAPEGRIEDWPVPDAVKEGEGPFPGMTRGMLMRVTWQDGKVRCWRRMKHGRPEMENVTEWSTDGRVVYSLTRWPDGPPLMLKKRLYEEAKDRPDATFLDATYFDACGLEMPTFSGWINSEPARSTILQLLARGGELREATAKRVQVLGENPERVAAERADPAKVREELARSVVSEGDIRKRLAELEQLRQAPAKWVYTFDLDPEVHYAPVRIEAQLEDGTLIKRFSSEDFQSIPGRDLSLPRKCLIERFKREPAPKPNPATYTRVYQLIESDGKPVDADRFVIEPDDPETKVYDRTKRNP